MTIKRAREVLGEKAEKLSDKEVQDLLNLLTIIVNKAIDEVVNK
jgi:hypothetical protein